MIDVQVPFRTPEQFIVTLQAVPDRDAVLAVIRLRRFLKSALRSYGLRCIRCEPADDGLQPWNQDDVKPADTGTAARIDWRAATFPGCCLRPQDDGGGRPGR